MPRKRRGHRPQQPKEDTVKFVVQIPDEFDFDVDLLDDVIELGRPHLGRGYFSYRVRTLDDEKEET